MIPFAPETARTLMDLCASAPRATFYALLSLLAAGGGVACGSDDGDPGTIDSEATLFPGQTGLVTPATGNDLVAGSSQPTSGGMPPDFTSADRGGWKLIGEIPADASLAPLEQDGREAGCGSILTGVLRDIQTAHPDFGGDTTNLQRGLVAQTLGASGKPELSDDYEDGFIESADSFSEWYETLPGVNQAFYLALYLAPNRDNFVFDSDEFFPLDGQGFGNEGQNHNFHFTFELHTRFQYSGGEVFRFSGDDDLWVYINGRLAIDLGGVHEAATQNISLDREASRLGITPGNSYTLDFFQAERHASESNFLIDTTLQFVDCGVVVR
jgi:fibro-slime domain-containing protein